MKVERARGGEDTFYIVIGIKSGLACFSSNSRFIEKPGRDGLKRSGSVRVGCGRSIRWIKKIDLLRVSLGSRTTQWVNWCI